MISEDVTYEQAESILQQLAKGSADDWNLAGLVQPSSLPSSPTSTEDEMRQLLRFARLPSRPTSPGTGGSLSGAALEQLVESAVDALIVFAEDGTIAFVNACAERIFGYRREELLGLSIELLVPDLWQAPWFEHARRSSEQSVASLDAEATEHVGRRSDGREFSVEISRNSFMSEEGPLITCTARDITDRKRLEARYRNLVEGIPAVTFLAALDFGDNELYVSPQIEQLLGFSQQEWLEDPVLWYTRLHPEDRERWHVEFAHTCATAAPFRSVYRFIARDGRVVWVQGEAKVVRDGLGNPLFLQGVAFDITERKVAEDALRTAYDELDTLVQQRTAELASTNRELQRALKEKESLLREIHHRVKNNLQVISSLLNLQSASIKDAQTLHAIRESQNRVRSMALIHEKLYKSTNLARVDLGPYIRDLAAALFRSYGIQGSRVALHVEIDDAHLTLDTAVPCGLIVTELVSNCLKHAFPQQQAGEITVSLDEVGRGTWTLVVRDNGTGFPAGVDPYQCESLGLQLVATLADQLGGRIHVQCDNGTRFRVQFSEPQAK